MLVHKDPIRNGPP